MGVSNNVGCDNSVGFDNAVVFAYAVDCGLTDARFMQMIRVVPVRWIMDCPIHVL